MDLLEIRKLVLIAVASDDVLMERLVLKGGNALELIYKIGSRASLDLDFSIEDDFADLESIQTRLFDALRDRFDAAGFTVFDERFFPRPSATGPGSPAKWGGYLAEFKLIPRDKYIELGADIEATRRNAQTIGGNQQRVFTIEISKFEYCRGKAVAEVDDYSVYVYTPLMIAVEKLRAICQQLPTYALRKNPAPRARDFYDIHSIAQAGMLEVEAPLTLELVREMFQIKSVPVDLLREIQSARDFHRQDWPRVQNAVRGPVEEFDFYFDFVVGIAKRITVLLDNTAST